MNWLGKQGKKCSLKKRFPKIVDVIHEIVRNAHPNPPSDNVDDAVKRWLKKAPWTHS